jgi:hypothetical protein
MNTSHEECEKTNPEEESTAGPEMNIETEHADAVADKLYPELSNDDRRDAMTNLRRYFEIALAIAEVQARAEAGLTEPTSVPTMKERSNVNLKL